MSVVLTFVTGAKVTTEIINKLLTNDNYTVADHSFFRIVDSRSSPAPKQQEEATEPPIPDSFKSEFIGAKALDLWANHGRIRDSTGGRATDINRNLIAELDDKSAETGTVVLYYDLGKKISGDPREQKGAWRIPIKWSVIPIFDEGEAQMGDYLETDKVDEDGILDMHALKASVGSDLEAYLGK